LQEKIDVAPSAAAPGDTNPSDATELCTVVPVLRPYYFWLNTPSGLGCLYNRWWP